MGRLKITVNWLLYSGLILVSPAVFSEKVAPEKIAYTNAISSGAWRNSSSVFSCSLEHDIPFYGRAQFRTGAGERSAFILRAKSSRFEPGQAEIIAHNPVWKADTREFSLGQAPAKKGRTPMWLDTDWAEQMLLQLYEGYELEISQKAWYQKRNDDLSSLVITPIGFRSAYSKYLNCITGLLPANFNQMKRSSIFFPAGEVEELPAPEVRKLDKILQIVKHDSRVRAFFIDGHTDSEGDRAANLELSKIRAEMVSAYLQRRGIPESWITLRWHGERYPVTSNGTAAGKAKNRRVTVRMERVEPIDVLPLADDQADDQSGEQEAE